jgi:hypothetical protein
VYPRRSIDLDSFSIVVLGYLGNTGHGVGEDVALTPMRWEDWLALPKQASASPWLGLFLRLDKPPSVPHFGGLAAMATMLISPSASIERPEKENERKKPSVGFNVLKFCGHGKASYKSNFSAFV